MSAVAVRNQLKRCKIKGKEIFLKRKWNVTTGNREKCEAQVF